MGPWHFCCVRMFFYYKHFQREKETYFSVTKKKNSRVTNSIMESPPFGGTHLDPLII